jgi:hypothetical protein
MQTNKKSLDWFHSLLRILLQETEDTLVII